MEPLGATSFEEAAPTEVTALEDQAVFSKAFVMGATEAKDVAQA